MMNLPFKLRENKDSCIPEGPAFSSAKQVQFSLNGTQVEFLAPKHKPESKYRKPIQPDSKYIFQDMSFSSNFNKRFQISDSWKHLSLFYRSWVFNGPWFTGGIAELDMSVIVIRPKELSDNISYFHPRAFEQAVGDYLTNEYSIFKVDGRSSLITPKNWQPIKGLPIIATRLQVVPDELVTLSYTTKEYVFFPVADQCIAVMSFEPTREGTGTEAEMDKVISRSTMLALIDDIISSLKITLSPEAKAWQDKALEGLDDASLIKNFPPMKWTTEKEDALWDSKHPDKVSLGREKKKE